MSDVRWDSIRAINGSQRDGFEELCAQLARHESPTGSEFIRTGSPDGGVECYCVLTSGEEWGWQAKFFRTALRESQWKQFDESVKRALDSHPNLKRYFVCVPRNRSDGRRSGTTTELDRWKKRVNQWREWAAERDMDVEFVWWGSFELTELLADSEQSGRLEFWFGDLTRFNQNWFRRRLDEAISSVGPRYTPELHIDVSVSEKLRLFAREKDAVDRIRARAKDVQDAFGSIRNESDGLSELDRDGAINRLLKAEEDVRGAFRQLSASSDVDIDIDSLVGALDDAGSCADELLTGLAETAVTSPSDEDSDDRVRDYRPNPYEVQQKNLYALQNALRITRRLAEEAAPLVNSNVLMLSGEAGIGKTHALCDVANQRVESGLPTVLLTGQRFLTKEAPWLQALHHLDLTSLDADTFLGAVEAAAQASDARALLIVDAINEAEGPFIWHSNLAPFLEQVKQYPWIACVLSIRAIYEDVMIPESVREGAVRVTHRGFADRSYEAARVYFEHYGLDLPSTPLLHPEFENSLFLKLFCQSLQWRGLRRLPREQYGIREVFDGLIEDVNERLGRQLDYNPDERPVNAALSALASVFAERQSRWIEQREAAKLVDGLIPSSGFSRSLYRALVSEGLLLENPDFRDPSGKGKIVSVAYERFADYLIAEHLIESHVDKANPAAAFQSDGRLAFLADEDNFIWRGVLEALCIQIPEQFGLELPRIMPTLFDSRSARSAFLTSLTWRSSQRRTDDERQQFIEILRRGKGVARDDVFDTLLLVATLPDHPLNGEYLHNFLQRWSMSDRDARWSIYLHEAYTYGEGGPVDRLLDWTSDLSIEARDSLESDVVDLAATTLAWMLTTSNRFVRDRATKGLVGLLTGRLAATARLLERFRDVDDLYVVERVYAVAYGVAARCHDPEEIEELATVVYESVFANGQPAPHILLRDYARGVVERALYLGTDIDLDEQLIRPPYQSLWPDIPSDKELEQLAPRPELDGIGRLNPIMAQELIHFSVRDWDFAKYIIGANHRSGPWLSRRLDEELWIQPEERMSALEEALPDTAKMALRAYRAAERKVPLRIHFVEPGGGSSGNDAPSIFVPDGEMTEEDYERAVEQAERAREHFLGTLDPERRERFFAIEREREGDGPGLDRNVIQRYVLRRVFELGWTVDRFGDFDLRVSEGRIRESRKPERIGKKYQWIAYHEILAFISDRYQFDSGYSDDPSQHRYSGPWQIHRRDIDPTASSPLKARGLTTRSAESDWWRGPKFELWRPDLSDRDWLDLKDDLPSLLKLVQAQSPEEDRTKWLNLRALRTWREPSLVELNEGSKSRREVWIHANAYLIDAALADDFYEWATRVDFWGRWMPEPQDETTVFVGEHGWSPAFADMFGDGSAYPIDVSRAPTPCPAPVHLTTSEYLREAGGYDCSFEDSRRFLVPSPIMIDRMGLRWLGNSADFYDSDGRVASFDPDPTGSDASLLVREESVRQLLEQEGLALVWTVLGEKMTVGGRSSWDWAGSLHITGAFRYLPDADADNCIQGELRFRQQFPEAGGD